jgi:hypothetical protein
MKLEEGIAKIYNASVDELWHLDSFEESELFIKSLITQPNTVIFSSTFRKV